MDIFVSYTTRDSYVNRELLISISAILSKHSTFYIDLLHNNAIDKQQLVEKMLSQAKLILLLSSKSIGESMWVQWELSEATRRNIPILRIPVTSNRSETLSHIEFKLALEFRGQIDNIL